MGVKGLWSLIQPAARPIQLETLRNKKIAVDASIWLHQFLRAVRDKEGNALRNSHIVGFFRRICKLLFYNIRPIFVFDGGAPPLKRITVAERRRRRAGVVDNMKRTAEKILAAQLQLRIVNDMEQQSLQDGSQTLPDDIVYQAELDLLPSELKKKRRRDEYDLPALNGKESIVKDQNDMRFATEDELRDYVAQFKPQDFDFDSATFRALPTEIQYEIITDIKLKSRQTSWERIDEMTRAAPTAFDFSQLQIKHLMHRNEMTQRLLQVNNMVSKTNEITPVRIAGERGREYVLVKNEDPNQGLGWSLPGVERKQLGSESKPVAVPASDEEEESEDELVFEEVTAPSPKSPSPAEEDKVIEAMKDSKRDFSDVMRKFALDDLERQKSFNEIDRELTDDNDDDDMIFEPISSGISEPRSRLNGEATRPYLQTASSANAVSILDDPGNYVSDEDLDFMFGQDFPAPEKSQSSPEVRPSEIVGEKAEAYPDIVSRDEDYASLYQMWLLEAPGAFRDKFGDYEHRLQNVIEVWPADAIQDELKSVRKRMDKLSTNDTRGVEALTFWERFLDAVYAARTRQASPQRDVVPATLRRENCHEAPKRKDIAERDDHRGPHTEKGEGISHHTPLVEELSDAESADTDVEMISTPMTEPVNPSPGILTEVAKSAAKRSPTTPKLNLKSSTLKRKQTHKRIAEPANPIAIKNNATDGSDPAVLPADEDTLAFIDVTNHQASISPNGEAQQRETTLSIRPQKVTVTESVKAPVKVDEVPKTTQSETRAPASDVSSGPLLDRPIPQPEVTSPAPKSTNPTPSKDTSDSFQLNPSVSNVSSVPSEEAVAEVEAVASTFVDDFGSDEDEVPGDLGAEDNEYARFLSQISNRDFSQIQAELNQDLKRLSAQQKSERRDADDVTKQMEDECKELLRLFGIPYVVSPMEAEAQCAELQRQNFVEGIITDDSDIFLFGGTRVYKNMFNSQKYVECYLMSDIQREMNIDRDMLITLAYILGSDYTEGLVGVGPVGAVELLNEFGGMPGKDCWEALLRFRDWWLQVQKGLAPDLKQETPFRRRFRKAHQKTATIKPEFPNVEVKRAYNHPVVDDSSEEFQWGIPDLDGIREFFYERLGWNETKTDDNVLPILREMNNHKVIGTQRSIDTFFDPTAGGGEFTKARGTKHKSRRVRNVLNQWKFRGRQAPGGEATTGDVTPPPSKRARIPPNQ